MSGVAEWRVEQTKAILEEFAEGPGGAADAMFRLGQIFAIMTLADEHVRERMGR